MNSIRLTRRGKIVVGVLVAVATLALFSLGMDLVTPEECKVSIAEMSDACKALL